MSTDDDLIRLRRRRRWAPGSPPRSCRRSRSPRPTSTGSPRSTASTRVPARRRGARAGRGRARSTPRSRPASSCRRRWPACRSRSRTSSPPRACRPPAARRSSRAGSAVRRHRRRAAARRRLADPRQDQHGRVRDGLLHRALGLRPDPQPVGPRPDPRRLRRRLRRRRWPRSRRRWRSAPTPAARSASPRARHRHRRRQADLRRRSPATAWSRCASSLDQAGPCARTVLDAALLHEVIGGHDPLDSTSIDAAGARRRRRGQGRRRRRPDAACGSASSASSAARATRPGVLARSTRRSSCSTELGAEVVEVACPHFEYALAAYYLILPTRGVVATSPGSTRCATACGSATTARTAPRRSWR